jgi:hypothetical protein
MPQPSNPYLGLVAQYAQQAGIDPKWAQATLLTENTPGDPRAVSPAGAVGLMQVMPANAAGANLADPMANIQRGVQILAANLKAAGGDKSKASAMYFDGPNAKTFGPGAYSYVKKVADNYNSLGTPDMNQPSATSQTPWIDSQLSQAQNEMAAPNSAPPPAQTAAATPWIDSQMAQT